MRRILSLILFGLVLLVIVDFVANNTAEADIALWPLPDALRLPLFGLVLAALIIGLVFGRISLWPRHIGLQRAHRRQARRIETLEAEAARHKTAIAAGQSV